MAKKHKLPNDIEGLQKLVLQLLERVEQLEAENAELRAENKELKHQLEMNSQNSHKPPSSDEFKKAKKKSQLPKELKAQGGQKGHKGKTLERVKNPDYIKVYAPISCICCKRQFNADEIEVVEQRQVFDLPPIRLEITEHQLCQVECCWMIRKGRFPKDVLAPVQYGAGIKALTTMLSVDYRMPLQKMTYLFADLYDYAINSATLLKNLKDGYDLLEPSEVQIKQGILKSYVAHFDETGIRCEYIAVIFYVVHIYLENFVHLLKLARNGQSQCSSSLFNSIKLNILLIRLMQDISVFLEQRIKKNLNQLKVLKVVLNNLRVGVFTTVCPLFLPPKRKKPSIG